MYRTTKYLVNSYVPTKVTETDKDLHSRLAEMTYNEIIEDFDYHFKNCYLTNFDLIHHECRGSKLEFSKKFYETIFYDKVKENLSEENKEKFLSAAIKSEREDVNIEKKLIIEHLKKVSFERNLEKKRNFSFSNEKKILL